MSCASDWPEVILAAKENRHELVLSRGDISKRIAEAGLHASLFELQNLNYLAIHETCLEVIPDAIAQLENLSTLVLHSNKIKTLPEAIGKLTKLRVLDCSRNQMDKLPRALANMPQLTSINFSSNILNELPSQLSNIKLSSLHLSNNKFEDFPDVCYPELVHLAEIRLNGNLIKEIPAAISRLGALKLLDLADNSIKVVPGELADCAKLKELNLKANCLADKRLSKLVDQCRTKQVLDYVRQHCPSVEKSENGGGGGKSKKGRKNRKNSENESGGKNLDSLCHKMKILKVVDENPVIKITEHVKTVRPHIAACIVRNLNFTDETFKKFIQLQTKLHEGICEKRNAATLATHDLSLLPPGDLTYTAKLPNEIKIKPLMRDKTFTGAALFQQLQTEAINLRKEKKRNVYSGIHKYLYLLEGKPLYPCLLDSKSQVVSFPPITNSDITKMSSSTKSMLVEVTSASTQQICRNVLDEFLKELLVLGLTNKSETGETQDFHELDVEQVKIVDMEGNMKVVYPSRTDLVFEDSTIAIFRE
ncbi:leucine-rich repeat-containing protein 47-like [Venturia canescens]|uniref:leucine-rich repeat-containing protein 47-like n=1 Tax=Venturia canescens TaxID=32260 RepID=UPI001C9BD713|nr:leucine-rich repeat-containing protein 47-like [Venturia canescens]